MIEKIDADMLVLQEVGSQRTLQTLNELLSQPYAHSGLRQGNSERSIHIGVLSKFKLHLTSHRELQLVDDQGAPMLEMRSAQAAQQNQPSPARLQRDILKVEVVVGGQKISVFCVHLKSRINQTWQIVDAQTLRQAESRLLADLVQQHLQVEGDHLTVVLGDFNDRPSADEFRVLTDLGLHDPQGVQNLSRGRNPTTYWPKRACRFDRILLCDGALSRLVEHSEVIHNTTMAKQASDHFPVSLELKV